MDDTSTLNVREDLQGRPYSEILQYQVHNTSPFSICILDVIGGLNASTMIRTACLMGAEKAFIYGRRKIDRRGLVGAQNYIDIDRVHGIVNEHLDYGKFRETVKDYTIVYCETTGEDITIFDWNFPGKPCFVFGNEGTGIPVEFLEDGHKIVSVPQHGAMRSLNVAVSSGIVMHEYVNRHLKKEKNETE